MIANDVIDFGATVRPTTMMQTIVRAMFFTLVMFSTSPFSAQARDLPVIGPPTGAPFRSDCSQDYVVGIYVRAGAWIDAIGLKCAAFEQDQKAFKNPPWNKPYHGGGGGAEQTGLCPFGSHVSGIKVGHTRDGKTRKFADYVELSCRSVSNGSVSKVCVGTGNGCWDSHPRPPGFGAMFFTAGPEQYSCSANEAAIGIHGRSGAFVDAVGLICGPKPAVVTASSSSSFPRRKRATAKNDVDIYDGPGGQFKIIGMMRKGTVSTVVYGKDGWVKLRRLYGSDIIGFVAEDHLTVTATR